MLKDHYINFHSTVKDNYFFKELFTPDFDKYSKRCIECGGLSFETSRKRTIVFCCIKKQPGGSLALSLNISRRGNAITIYSLNYSIHKCSYDFFDAEKTIRRFILAVKNKFKHESKGKVQGTLILLTLSHQGKK